MKKLLFVATAILFLGSCQDDPVAPTTTPTNPTGPTNPSSTYHATFKVDGVSISHVEGTNGYYGSTSTGGGIDSQNNIRTVDSDAGMVAFDNVSGDILAYGNVGFDNYEFNLQTYNSDKPAALASMMTVGNHTYFLDGSASSGVQFEYYDGVNLWSTKYGTQNASAAFNVTSSVAKSSALGYTLREVIGTFSGKVYSENGSSFKTVTDGDFKLIFEAP